MKILVLGANGQVGSELGAQLDSLARLEGERFTVVFANRSSVDVTNLDSLKSFWVITNLNGLLMRRHTRLLIVLSLRCLKLTA